MRCLARCAKRIFDVLASLALLVLLSPLIGLIALAVRLSLGAPVLFRQQRPGLHGVPFALVKFRTMADARDANGRLLPDAMRITRLGQFLRRNSLDELPELWNVLVGDMSLVGPRPLLMQYLPRFSPEQARRHEVRPGLTGWAQVNGRNATDWPTRLQLDVYYVDHWSLVLDLAILARTLWVVMRREGITAPGEASMPEFMGND